MTKPLTVEQTTAIAGAARALTERGHLALWQFRALLREMADRGLLDHDPELLEALDDGDRRILNEGEGEG